MHKTILGAATAALLLATTAAWAGNAQGTIQSIDTQNHQVTLDDGKTYKAMDGVDLAALKAGDSVTIQTKEEDGETVITKITKS